jgi:hypothetical protein
VKNYEFVFTQFQDEFGDRLADSITPDEILSFLTKLTDGRREKWWVLIYDRMIYGAFAQPMHLAPSRRLR